MRRLVTLLLCITFAGFYSCGPSGSSDEKGSKLKKADKGDRYYGGVFKVNESEYIKNLYPPTIHDAYSYRVAAQVYEGLLKFDQEDLSIKKGLAKKYEVDSSRTTYTFHLKEGVKFHKDPCFKNEEERELTAEDVKYCFKQLCTQDVNNQNFFIVDGILKGATEYYNKTKKDKNPEFDIEGIEVVDDYTIKFHLTEPNSIFKYNLARPGTFIYPKEAHKKYGLKMRSKAVGTGPFKIHSIKEDISIILKKYEDYHATDKFGNQLPYLDAVRIEFIKDKKTELYEFKKGNLDMIYRLPTEYIIEILEGARSDKPGEYSDYKLQRTPEMATQLLGFMMEDSLLENKDLRKAISYAINREKIFNYVLKGEGHAPGHHGVTPPTFEGYNTDDINGYKLNVDSARYYLKKAGYPNGKGLPPITLDLNAAADRNVRVAVEVQNQLEKNLNINMKLNTLPMSQHSENMLSGKSSFFRVGWIADYPHPENFLWFFNSSKVPDSTHKKSYPNLTRYSNPKFDSLYQEALNASSQEKTYKLFKKAEQIAMSDAPVVVLWYEEGYRLMNSNIRNFPINPMQYRDFSEVYFVPKNNTKDKAEKAQ